MLFSLSQAAELRPEGEETFHPPPLEISPVLVSPNASANASDLHLTHCHSALITDLFLFVCLIWPSLRSEEFGSIVIISPRWDRPPSWILLSSSVSVSVGGLSASIFPQHGMASSF
ncbi:hypothetical protein EYF80_004099 [Liparis tanakae]|uniref:Uncharacterized protein n=1 Tax=Liparis tanakae TaxID=230148 RepID=A0A4Z2J626_9TELE|nr:hypothetical protein EYF80_004099 [Liparis tanakae]